MTSASEQPAITAGCAAERVPWRDRLACALAWGVLRAGIYAGPVQRWRRRRVSLDGAEPFEVTTDDGVRIAALRLRAARPDPTKLPAIVLHGWSENKECRLRQARLLTAHGHDAILLDFRAHGRSTGRCATFGVRERHDVKAVLDEAQRRGWVGARVLTLGLSLGGATALQHAAVDPRVAKVVALAPFADMARAVNSYRKRHFPLAPEQWALRGFARAAQQAGFDMAEASTVEAMRRLRIPVLLVVGQRDRNLTLEDHTRVLAAACASGQCELLEVPGATHFTLTGGPWPGLDEAMVRFCGA